MCDGVVAGLTPAFRHLTGENVNICRLCFDAVESGVNFHENIFIECFYYDGTVTFFDMLTELRISTEPTLPQVLCDICANLTIQAFSFAKLSQHSDNKLHEAVMRLNQATEMTDTIPTTSKTCYLLIKENSDEVIYGWKSKTNKSDLAKRLSKHLQRHHNEIAHTRNEATTLSTTVCDQCGKEVKNNRLSYHMKRNHSINKYPCHSCSKIFDDAQKLHEHTEENHKQIMQCPHCDKMFSFRSIRMHILNFHTEGTCKVCSLRFPTNIALKKHSRQHRLLHCHRCYKIFQDQETFNCHCKTCVDNSETITCDISKKDFQTRALLISHLSSKHGYTYFHTCNWCGKKFVHRSGLKSHIITHTQERKFSCDQCGGEFVTKAALVFHIRIHTGEKPYPCGTCGERFLSKSRRMDHMKRRHRPPGYPCSLCDKKFKSKFRLRKHYVRHKNPKSKLYVSELLPEL